MAKNKSFKVIKDTREQEGYYFSEYGTCSGMVERKLDTGGLNMHRTQRMCRGTCSKLRSEKARIFK